jgi:hypothetical protein
MARIRSIKPEFWDDRKLARATSRDARLFYIGLWNHSDEHSRCNGDPVWLAAQIYPYEDDIGAAECATFLDELTAVGAVVKYTVQGDPYLFLPKLGGHQRLEPKKVASKYPSPDEADPETPSDLHVQTSTRAAQVFSDEPAPDAESSALLYVAGSMEHVAGSMSVVPRDADSSAPTDDDPTSRLLIEHVKAHKNEPPPSAQSTVKVEIMRLVAEHVPEEHIRAGLGILRQKTHLHPKLLPQLVVEAMNPPKPRPNGSRNGQILSAAMQRAQAAEAQQKALGS